MTTSTTPNRNRSASFADIDTSSASGILEDILRDQNVLLGGSSIGKGFKMAAKTYLQQQQEQTKEEYANHPDLCIDSETSCVEDAFYVVDLGVIVSQVYQWRRLFPRVEPFYAVKCNPDPVIVQTLALLGCNFDCASQQEIEIVQACTQQLGPRLKRKPDIIYANPCKARKHLMYAVTRGVRMVTFDNVLEVEKCAKISKKIELVLRIVTDDRGAQCRLSSKYGAHKQQWRNLLGAAKKHGLKVVGVSFHVGSGCRDASRYELALADARELFDLALSEYGFDLKLLDIGGGFPGETHSVWNPNVLDVFDDMNKEEHDEADKEGLEKGSDDEAEEEAKKGSSDGEDETPYMFFMEIAEQVAPMIDKLFDYDVRVIGEPGRYFVAAAATLVTAIVGARSNEIDHQQFTPEAFSDAKTSLDVFKMSRKEESDIVRHRGNSFDGSSAGGTNGGDDWGGITTELHQYSRYVARQELVTQETDTYNDGLDLYNEDFDTAVDLLGIPDQKQMKHIVHSVEGMSKAVATGDENQGIISLAAAGEAVVSGMIMQAVADSSPMQDDFAYYVNDGVYGAFNNLMFDHATVRPRVLRLPTAGAETEKAKDQSLYASTIFGPTCDSIDVISRSVLMPKLKIGDWLYFQNMGAYTMAAASSFNGFTPTEKMYVCSVMPEYFEGLIAGPDSEQATEATATCTAANHANDKMISSVCEEDESIKEEKKEEKCY